MNCCSTKYIKFTIKLSLNIIFIVIQVAVLGHSFPRSEQIVYQNNYRSILFWLVVIFFSDLGNYKDSYGVPLSDTNL